MVGVVLWPGARQNAPGHFFLIHFIIYHKIHLYSLCEFLYLMPPIFNAAKEKLEIVTLLR